jgi:molybdopterin/thiamine biosynthesis adenylyltransferase
LIIGAGGLGCPAATYLATSGVGRIEWVDGDRVEATNLARQTLFSPQDIGQHKVVAGASALGRLNPSIEIMTHPINADEKFLNERIPQVDLVLDCTDRWVMRQLINACCIRHQKPLVTAAAIEWTGQLLSIIPSHPEHACYACVFDPDTIPDEHACGAYGVLAPLVGAMGCLQAAEALKVLIRNPKGTQKSGQMLTMVDARTGNWQQVSLRRNPGCSVCSTRQG